MASVKTNMIAKKKRRIRPKEGDIFRVEMASGVELSGRVARILETPGVGEAALVYFFTPGSKELVTENLLVPPKLVAPTIFNHGFFEIACNRPFAPRERYARHCFHDGMQRYFDADGSRIDTPFEPLVFDACETIPTLDQALSRALEAKHASSRSEAPETRNTGTGDDGAVRPDELEAFWSTVARAQKAARGDGQKFVQALENELSRAPRGGVQSFARVQSRLLERANTWDLWGAAFIVNGGCSDDGFEYFRAWLIGQGKEIFEAAIARPEILVEVAKDNDEHELEEFLCVAGRVFEERFDEPLGAATGTREPTGQPWEEEDLPARFPALWARFGEA